MDFISTFSIRIILKKETFLFILLLSFLSISYAQIQEDKLSFEDDFKQSFEARPKLDVKFDNRFSFIRDNDVKTLGLKVGLSFRRRFKMGIGVNQMILSGERRINQFDTTLQVFLEYFYVSPYIEYTYFNSKRWEFSLSTQFGFGEASYQYNNLDGKRIKHKKSTVLSYEPAMLIDYKIIRWFGIGTGVGYRMIYYKSPGVNEKFSSPEYVIKLKVYLGEIFRTITGKDLDIDD